MEETYHMYGMKITVSGDIEEARRQGQLARKLMFQTKNLNSNDLEIIKGGMKLDNGTVVEVLSQYGLDSARIYVPPPAPKRKPIREVVPIQEIVPALEAFDVDENFLGFILFLGGGWGKHLEFVPAADPESDDSMVDAFKWGQWLENFEDKPFANVGTFLTPKVVPWRENLLEIPSRGTLNRAFKSTVVLADTDTCSAGAPSKAGSLYSRSIAASGEYRAISFFSYSEKGEDGAKPPLDPESGRDDAYLPWDKKIPAPTEGSRETTSLSGEATAKKRAPTYIYSKQPFGMYRSIKEIDLFDVDVLPDGFNALVGFDLFERLTFLPEPHIRYELDKAYPYLPWANEYLTYADRTGSNWVTTTVRWHATIENDYFHGKPEWTSVYSESQYALAYARIQIDNDSQEQDSFWSHGDEDDFTYWFGDGAGAFYNYPGAHIVPKTRQFSGPKIMVNLSGEEHEIGDVFVSEDTTGDWFDFTYDSPSPITIRYYNFASEFLICALDFSEISDSECEYRYVFGQKTDQGAKFDDSLVLSGDREGWAEFPDMKGQDDESLYVKNKFRLMVIEREQLVYEHEIEAV